MIRLSRISGMELWNGALVVITCNARKLNYFIKLIRSWIGDTDYQQGYKEGAKDIHVFSLYRSP